jgi:hypothetical protein
MKYTLTFLVALSSLFASAQTISKPDDGSFDFLYNFKVPDLPAVNSFPSHFFSPKDKNIVSIDGKLKDGNTVKVTFSNSGIYEGLVHDKRESKQYKLGVGKFTFTNGDIYEGDCGLNSYSDYTNGIYTIKDGIKIQFRTSEKDSNYNEGIYYYPNGDSCVSSLSYYNNDRSFHYYFKTGENVFAYFNTKTHKMSDKFFDYFTKDKIEYTGDLYQGVPHGYWEALYNNKVIQYYYFDKGVLTGIVDKTLLAATSKYVLFINNKLISNAVKEVAKYENRVYCFKGDCQNGEVQFYESDRLTPPKNSITTVTYKNGVPISDATRIIYDEKMNVISFGKGSFKNYLLDGDYTEATVDGSSSFTGKYQKGLKISGIEHWSDGRIFNGSYEKNKPHSGTLTFANHERYEGEFNESGMFGKGNYYFPNGDRLGSNLFKNDFVIACTLYKAEGKEYYGEYDFKKKEFTAKDYIADFKKMMKSYEDAKTAAAQQQYTNNNNAGHTCPTCNGSGNNMMACPMCKGNGKSDTWMKVDAFGRYAGKGTCIYCRGNGTISAGSCGTCRGSGKSN